jgi:hypothetical protein
VVLLDVVWRLIMLDVEFYGMGLAQLLALLVIGICWSGTVWMIVDWARGFLNWKEVHEVGKLRALKLAPLCIGMIGANALMPWAIIGLGGAVETTLASHGAYTICGIIAGMAAKTGHDYTREFMQATLGKITKTIGGLGGE